MNVTLKNGKQAILGIDTKEQNATLTVGATKHLIGFVRDAKKVVIKNDMLLNASELSYVKQELGKFIKKEETSKKRK